MARTRQSRRRLGTLLAAVGLLAIGCGELLGFEEFEEGSEETESGGTSGGCTDADQCASDWMCVAGVCTEGCTPGALFCTGKTLHRCNEEGTDAISESAECASVDHCEESVDGDDGGVRCVEQCVPTTGKCEGGDTGPLEGSYCDSNEMWVDATCKDQEQCDPESGECIDLKIDPTEVTREDYDKFLAANHHSDPPAGCEGNIEDPDEECLEDNARYGTVCTEDCDKYPDVCVDDCSQHPQVCIDWCDAYAYCAWNGQRLCGRLDDGKEFYPGDDFLQAGDSEWTNACTGGRQYDHAYKGPFPELGGEGCTYRDVPPHTTYAVGTREECHSPAFGYKHIHDLSGNVAEWENNCAGGHCTPRGGSFDSPVEHLDCAVVFDALPHTATQPWLGFRCCGPDEE